MDIEEINITENREEKILKSVKLFEKEHPNLSLNDKIKFISNKSGDTYNNLYWHYIKIRTENLQKEFLNVLKGFSYEDAIKELRQYSIILENKAMNNEL